MTRPSRGVVEFEAGRGVVDAVRAADVFVVVDRFLRGGRTEAARPRDLALLARTEGDVDDDG